MKKALFLLTITAFAVSAFSFTDRMQEDPWAHVPDNFKGLKNPVTPDKASLEAGKVLYSSYCLACHGADGKGNGNRASRLKGVPSDFTQQAFKAHSDGEILYVIYSGHDQMPGFKKKLLPGKAEVVTGTFGKTRNPGDLVNYVRSFAK
jgi:mono/diheme cytochrome c family protein